SCARHYNFRFLNNSSDSCAGKAKKENLLSRSEGAVRDFRCGFHQGDRRLTRAGATEHKQMTSCAEKQCALLAQFEITHARCPTTPLRLAAAERAVAAGQGL